MADEPKPWEIAAQQQATPEKKPWEVAAETLNPSSQSLTNTQATPSNGVSNDSGGQKKSDVGSSTTSAGQQITGGASSKKSGTGYEWADTKITTPLAGQAESEYTENSLAPHLERLNQLTKAIDNNSPIYQELNAKVVDAQMALNKNMDYKPMQAMGDLINKQKSIDPKAKDAQSKWDALEKKINDIRNTKVNVMDNKQLAGWNPSDTDTQQLATMPNVTTPYKTYGEMYDSSLEYQKTVSDGQPILNQQKPQLDADITEARKIKGYTGKQMGIAETFTHAFYQSMDKVVDAVANYNLTDAEQIEFNKRKDIENNIIYPKTDAPGVFGYAASATGGLAPLAMAGFVGSATGTLPALALSGLTFGLMEAGAGRQEGWEEGKAKGLNDADALAFSKKMSSIRGSIGGVLGAGLPGVGALGEKLLLNDVEKTVFAKFWADNLVTATAFGASQMTQNILANYISGGKIDRGIMEGVDQQVGGAFALTTMMTALHAAANGTTTLLNSNKNIFEMAWAKRLPEAQATINEATTKGIITPDAGAKIMKGIQEKAEALAMMPKGLTDEQQVTAQPYFTKLLNLLADKEIDKTEISHPGIDAEIQKTIREVREKVGMPLSPDEAKTYSDLKARTTEMADGKVKNPLNDVEQSDLDHLQTRIDNNNEEKDKGILAMQKKNDLPITPELNLTQAAKDKLQDIEDGKIITNQTRNETNAGLAPLVKELNNKIDVLTKTRDNPNRQFTHGQIDAAISDLQNKVDKIEAARNKIGVAEPISFAEPAVKVGNVDVVDHGQDTDTQRGLNNGQNATDLTEQGKEEAKQKGLDFAKDNPDLTTIYHSPVERAIQTAVIAAKSATEALGRQVSAKAKEVLKTWDIGSWVHTPETEFDEEYYVNHPDQKVGGGETFNDFKDRAIKAWNWVKTLGDDKAVITHSKMQKMFKALNETDGVWNDKAKEIYLKDENIVEPKTKDNAKAIRSDAGQVQEGRNDGQGGEGESGENIQQPASKKAGNEKQQVGNLEEKPVAENTEIGRQEPQILSPEGKPTDNTIGKTVEFEHAGSPVKGKIESIDSKGNYKIRESDGTVHTVKPEETKEITPEATGLDKFKEGLNDFLNAPPGGGLALLGPKHIEALAKMGEGLIEAGKATIDNVMERIKDYLRSAGHPIDDKLEQDLKDSEANIVQRISDNQNRLKASDVTGLTDEQRAAQLKQQLTENREANNKSLVQRVKNTKLFQGAASAIRAIHPLFTDMGRKSYSILREHFDKYENSLNKFSADSKERELEWAKVPEAERMLFIDKLQSGEKQSTPELQHLADLYNKLNDAAYDEVSKVKDVDYISNYMAQMWKDKGKAQTFFSDYFSKNPLEGNKQFLKQRYYDSYRAGIENGLVPEYTNPEKLVQVTFNRAMRLKMANDVFNTMNKELGADKGMILVQRGQNAPEGYSPINDPLWDSKAGKTASAIRENGRITAKAAGEEPEAARTGQDKYYAPNEVASVINNFTSAGVENQLGKSIINGARAVNTLFNMFQLGWSPFHAFVTATFASQMRLGIGLDRVLTGGIQLTKGDISGAAENFKKGAKDIFMSAGGIPLSPQLVKNYIDGYQLRNQLNNGIKNADTDLIIRGGGRAKAHAMYQMDGWNNLKFAIAELKSGDNNLSAAGKIGFNGFTSAMELGIKPIMDYHVPFMKLGAFMDNARREMERLGPDASEREMTIAVQKAWDSSDNMLGQLNYDHVATNKIVKEIAQTAGRAPGWFKGEVDEALRGSIGDEGIFGKGGKEFLEGKGMTPKMRSVVGGIAGTMFFGAMYQYIRTQQTPQEMKDYFFPKDGSKNTDGTDHRVTVNPYAKDLYDLATHPVQTVENKSAPSIEALEELAKNKNYYGEQIRSEESTPLQQAGEVGKYALKQLVPFAYRTQTGSLNPTQQKEQFFGIQAAPRPVQLETNKQKVIYHEATNQFEQVDKPRTHAEMEKYQALRDLRAKISLGQNYSNDLKAAQDKGYLTEHNTDKFISDSHLNYFNREFKNFPTERQLKVLKQLSPEDAKSLMEFTHKPSVWYKLQREKPELFQDDASKAVFKQVTR